MNHRIDAGGPAWLPAVTAVAFAVLLAVVVARLLTPDMLREPTAALPGNARGPRAPGPATGLLLDLLSCVPALLVLGRRAVDPAYRLAPRWSHVPLAGLTLWMLASTAWATDTFAAAVMASHFAAAAALFWAASQLVRTQRHMRAVAAVAAGLLLAIAAQTVLYRLSDVPATRDYWLNNKAQILRERGIEPGSFAAGQFERTILSGQQLGSFASANTLAAVGVLLLAVSAGVAVPRVVRREQPPPAVVTVDAAGAGRLALVLAAGAWVIYLGHSKTAVATPVFGVAVAAAWWRYGPFLRRRPAAAYAGAVAAVPLALLAVVGHGLYHGGLFPGHLSNSLDFRWKYWTASAHLFADHPILGVGWANFGSYYLAYRRPEAAEEIKDPHDFLVRFAVELGVVGLALATAWLLRLAWETTRPSPSTDDGEVVAWRPVLVAVVVGGILSAATTVDPSAGFAEAVVLSAKPVIGTVGLCGGVLLALRVAGSTRWLLPLLLIGLGLFLLHNLIDFSLFETGPLCLFMALAGSALGVAPSTGTGRSHRPAAVAVAVGSAFAWASAAVGFVAPVVIAEQLAAAGDEAIAASGENARRAVEDARAAYAGAARLVPYNADYHLRLARAALAARDAAGFAAAVAAAERANPRDLDAYLTDAGVRPANGPPDQAAATRRDYDRVLALNPNDAAIHARYGDALAARGRPADAQRQYAAALAVDAALPAEEPKRLPAAALDLLRAKAGRAADQTPPPARSAPGTAADPSRGR